MSGVGVVEDLTVAHPASRAKSIVRLVGLEASRAAGHLGRMATDRSVGSV